MYYILIEKSVEDGIENMKEGLMGEWMIDDKIWNIYLGLSIE